MSDRMRAGERVLVEVTRQDAALLRAAASLATFAGERRRSGHLVRPLLELAERIEARLRPVRRAA